MMILLYFTVTVFSILGLGELKEPKATCQNDNVAREKFEYYTLWYRFKHGILLWTTRKICALTEEESKYVCAQIAQACFPHLNDFPVENIEKEIKTVPGDCKKETYKTPKTNSPSSDYSGGWKKMYPCPLYTANGEEVTSFFVSYGGSPGTALIFERESTKHQNIDAPPSEERGTRSFIKLKHYVSDLQMEKPKIADNNQKKPDPNQSTQKKPDQSADAQSEPDKKDAQTTETQPAST